MKSIAQNGVGKQLVPTFTLEGIDNAVAKPGHVQTYVQRNLTRNGLDPPTLEELLVNNVWARTKELNPPLNQRIVSHPYCYANQFFYII